MTFSNISTAPASLAKRPYGDTGIELSIIALGGVVVSNMEQKYVNRLVAEAFDRGINYFDVAPIYGDAQDRLGPALAPYRKETFLSCKTIERNRAAAEADFKKSLALLKTDYFDLYQLHSLTSVEDDVEPLFVKNGVMDMLIEAKKSGQIRFLGFSAHSEEAALAVMDYYDFNSVLIGINFAAYFRNGYTSNVIAKAQEKGMAILAMKAMAKQHWAEGDPKRETYKNIWYEPLTNLEMAELALRWTLSQPVTAVFPPGEELLWRMAVEFASRFIPITPDEEMRLKTYADTVNPIFPLAW